MRPLRSSFALSSFALLATFFTVAPGCSSSPSDAASRTRQADEISDSDDPSTLLPGASQRLADNVVAADVGQTFGTPDDRIPYPDTYWPMTDDGCDAHWNGDGTQSPLEKLMAIADASHSADAKTWEKANHGSGVPGVQGWYGHCPGWTGSAMLNAPLKHAAFAKSDGSGGVAPCNDGDAGCVKFEIADINALEAEVYVDAESRFIGNRCDTKPADIKRDQFGRIERNGSGCQGLNAGSLLVVLGTQMKARHAAMAIDAQNDFNTDQIWNQPAYRYTVNRFETLKEAEAANLVAHGQKTGDQTKYAWNDAAKGFALVDVSLSWVSERGPNTEPVSGLDSTRTTRMVAVIELDTDASSPDAKILGGEYIDDASVGADRLTVPPFVWIASDAGPEDLGTWVGGNSHNPYVKPSLVKKLVAMAQQ